MLKSYLRSIPGYQQIRRLLLQFRVLTYSTKSGLWPKRASSHQHKQAILSWPVLTPQLTSYRDLLEWLEGKGIQFFEGRHTLYLPPQPGLQDVLGEVVNSYPADAGWKILKDLRGPRDARCVSLRDFPADCFIVGDIEGRIQSANYLYMKRIGPRLYDVVELVSEANELTAFVVQHISGPTPTQVQCEKLLSRIERALACQELSTAIPNWWEHKDSRCPDCNENLKIGENGQAFYVDFQHFVVSNCDGIVSGILDSARKDVHFGQEIFFRGGQYLYQSVPGVNKTAKRDSTIRWQAIKQLLVEAGISLQGRIILDIGCNAGVMLSSALAEGAHWGLGWDKPEIVEHAEKLLLMMGLTRFTLTGAKLKQEYPLRQDVPSHLLGSLDGSVVFYLAVRKHLGFLSALAEVPWQVMVYEGHEDDSVHTLHDQLSSLTRMVQCTIVAQAKCKDGDSRPRPLAVIIRNN